MKPAPSMPSCALPECGLSFAPEENSSSKSKMPSQEVASCSPTRQKRSGQEIERQTDGVMHPRLDCMHLSQRKSLFSKSIARRFWKLAATSQCRQPSVSGCRSLAFTFHVVFLLCLSLQRYFWLGAKPSPAPMLSRQPRKIAGAQLEWR